MKLEQIYDAFYNLDLITSIGPYDDGPTLTPPENWQITFAGGEKVLVTNEEGERILGLLT